jgi:DNA-binding CsgD family transcriptional regulator
MSIPTKHLIQMIESAYRVETSESDWLGGVLDSFRTARPDGVGWLGYFIDAADPDVFQTWGYTEVGEVRRGAAGFRKWNRETPTPVKRLIHFHAPCNYGTRIPATGDMADALKKTRGTHQEVEMFGLNALDAHGRGCTLVATLLDVHRPLRAPAIAAWERVAVHLATAARIGRRLRDTQRALTDDPDAVVRADGHIEHAAGQATAKSMRTALRDAAVRIDATRSRAGRLDPDEATRGWQALVAGRWTLVDTFDRGDRRYYVACPNVPGARAVTSLSETEARVVASACLGHSNKVIAFELGVSESTVATHLRRAARKLGARSRLELITLFDARHPR